MKVDQMTLTINLDESGEPDAIRRLQKMVNYGLISEEDTVKVGRRDRCGAGVVCYTVGDFLK
jgi:hypothetical protein